jgi:site-specific DNA-methyltransferase (adenine-specific)
MMYQQLQNGTICNGDCLELMKTIPDKFVDMILCDLPYGTTACKWDTVIPFEPLWEQYKRIIKDNGAIVLTASQPFTSALVMSNIGLFRYTWYWNKTKPTGFPNANHMPLRDVEDVLVFSRGKPNPAAKEKMPYNPQGIVVSAKFKRRKTREGTVNNGERDGSLAGDYTTQFENYPRQLLLFPSEGKTIHPTQKPVALFEYLIKTYTNEGDLVLDNCSGSGTTAIACINTNRKYICMEMDKGYYEKSIERVRNHKCT